MADFNSKYTGNQVEALLDIVQQGGIGGGEGEVQKTTEVEILAMGFTKNLGTITEVKMNGESKGTSGVVDLGSVITSHQDISGKQDKITDLDTIREGASKGATALQSIPSEYVTESILDKKGYATTTALNDKVDKVDGKQLSAEDFTTAFKNKLESLSNYDDTSINQAVTSLRSDFDKLVSGDTTTAIKTFNEVIAFLDGISDTQDLSSIIASIEQQIGGKQDKINDLVTIRSNAEKGATAVQPSSLASVATSGSYDDLNNKPTIPTTTSQLGNDTNFVSSDNLKTINGQSIVGSGNIIIEGVGSSSSGEKEVININNGVIESLESNNIYILENIADSTFEIQSIVEPPEDYAEYTVIIDTRMATGSGDEVPPTIILPEVVQWANGAIPDVSENGCYELSIVSYKGMFSSGYNAVLTRFS